MTEKYLPIGSIVLLKGATRELMVTGYLPITTIEGKTQVFDYSGCIFPDGILNSDQLGLFNHDQIDKIIYKGYINEESTKYLTELNNIQKEEILKSIEKDINSSQEDNNNGSTIEELDF